MKLWFVATTTRITEVVIIAKQIFCNKCGKEFDFWDTQEHFSITTPIGYGSDYDGDNLELDLCCKCMDELISQCKITPIAPTN